MGPIDRRAKTRNQGKRGSARLDHDTNLYFRVVEIVDVVEGRESQEILYSACLGPAVAAIDKKSELEDRKECEK